MLLVLSLLACATPGPAPEPAASAAPEERVLVLDPMLLSWDEAAGQVRFEEDSNVQKAAYNVYVFDAKDVEATLGGRPSAPVTVRVTVLSVEERTVTPEDPNMPSPAGGFRITTIQADLVGAE